mgnify:CR=1 FL=1
MFRTAQPFPATRPAGRPRTSRALVTAALLAATLLGSTACTRHSREGAAIGAVTGAGLGALGGHGIFRGAATGAVVGGAGGYIYDKVKDWD